MSEFFGFVQLDDTVRLPFQSRDADNQPADADALPTYAIYGPNGQEILNGTSAFFHNGVITGASNATPIVITSAAHGLNSGQRVTISGVLGNTAANGEWVATVINSSTFSLVGSVGNGSYTSGGIWHVTGLYKVQVAVTEANGFLEGKTFVAALDYEVDSDARRDLLSLIPN